MEEYWNIGRRPPLEGRALSRPATTKRGPPKAGFQLPPIIPTFPYSNIPVEVTYKRLRTVKLSRIPFAVLQLEQFPVDVVALFKKAVERCEHAVLRATDSACFKRERLAWHRLDTTPTPAP